MFIKFHSFLTSALDRGRWSAYRSGYFTLIERMSSTNLRGIWVGPRARQDVLEKKYIC